MRSKFGRDFIQLLAGRNHIAKVEPALRGFEVEPNSFEVCTASAKQLEEWKLLSNEVMTLQLISENSGRSYKLTRKVLARLLYLARNEGWCHERVPPEGNSESWNPANNLTPFEPYMSGRVSRRDAEGLRIALTRALATGSVAADGTVQFTAGTLLQVAREGPFLVNLDQSESWVAQPLDAAVLASRDSEITVSN